MSTEETQGDSFCPVCKARFLKDPGVEFRFCSIECHERAIDIAHALHSVRSAFETVTRDHERIVERIEALEDRRRRLIQELRLLGSEWTKVFGAGDRNGIWIIEVEEKRVSAKARVLDRRVEKLEQRAFLVNEEAKQLQNKLHRLKGAEDQV